MKEKRLFPCPEWAEKVAMLHEEDLSPSELAALNEHLSSCSACAVIHRQHRQIRTALTKDVSFEPPCELPPELAQRWERLNEYEGGICIDVSSEVKREARSWRRVIDGLDSIDFDRLFYSDVWFPFRNDQKPPQEDQQSH